MKNVISTVGVLAITLVMIFAFNSVNENNLEKFGPHLSKLLKETNQTKYTVWVYFKDKGTNAELQLSNPLKLVTQESLNRRSKVLPKDKLVDYTDIPIFEPYINSIRNNSIKIRTKSKWLNSISIEATKPQLYEISNYDFVNKIELVERYRRNNFEYISENESDNSNYTDEPDVDSLNYGTGNAVIQITQIKVNIVHNEGIFGQGVKIAVFDAGFSNLGHEVFNTLPMKIERRYDFHDNDTTLANHSHGTATLSLVGGYKPTKLIGPAFKSTFYLARTEVDPGEMNYEMDHWIAAAEWADSLGVDVISSSLGYLEFDQGQISYTWQDMNGNTLPITIAADLAVKKGIVVCNSAGNNGYNASHNTLNGPADGDSVLTVGGVTTSNTYWTTSSVGPTTDNPPRIKPDVVALASGNYIAGTTTITSYSNGSGTSFSCPLAAGVASLILSANKDLTPMQVVMIMRKFGSNASNPNIQIGWGIIDAQKSVDSARKLDTTKPVIIHTQPFTTTTSTDTIILKAIIKDNGIIRYTRTNEAPRIYYRKNSGSGWTNFAGALYSSVVKDTFYFKIPGSGYTTQVEYYFAAQDIKLPTPLVSTLPSGGSGVNPPGSTPPSSRFSYTVTPVSIIKNENSTATEFKLYDNYPNPFNATTNIKFSIIENSEVVIKVYDVTGKLIKTIFNGNLTKGIYTFLFDANDLTSGIYFINFIAGNYKENKKIVLQK